MAIAAGRHRDPRVELGIAKLAVPSGIGLYVIALVLSPALLTWVGPGGIAVAALVGIAGTIVALFGLVALGLWFFDRT